MQEHFQNEETVKFQISDGSEFGYKPMTAGEENDNLGYYMVTEQYVDEQGNTRTRKVEDITKLNMVKCFNLVEAPYDNWKEKSKEERWVLIKKLKPQIFNEIITNINKIDRGDTADKKN